MASRNYAAILATILMVGNVFAEDLGRRAETYPTDRDGREQLKDIARQKETSGEVARYWKDYQRKALEGINNPPPLGVQTNYRSYSREYSVRFSFASDMKDDKGNTVVRKGTKIEPLRLAPLTSGLLFIDGRDQKQIDYAIEKGRLNPLKIVLTAGSFIELRKRYENSEWRGQKGIPFYYDQRKMIINSLQKLYNINIDSVPAIVTQRGVGLHIDYGMDGTR